MWRFYFLFVGIGILWAILIPPLEKPDEIHHVAYIQFVALEGRLPVQKQESWGGLLDFEAHQPPLYYILGGVFYRAISELGVERHLALDWANRLNPNYVGRAQSVPIEQTFFVHEGSFFRPDAAFPYDMILLRLYSVLVASIGVVATFNTCRLIWGPSIWPAVTVTSLGAFVPQLSFITSSTTNDALVYAVGMVVIYQMVRMIRSASRQDEFRQYALLGALLGVAILTKLSLISLMPVAIMVPLLAGTRSAHALVRIWLILGAGFLLVSGWWFVRNWMLYQDLLGSHWNVNPEAFTWDLDPKSLFSDYFRLHSFWLWTGRSFVGRFGFMHLDMQASFYPVYLLIFATGGLGFLLSFLRKDESLTLPLKWLMILLIMAAAVQLVALNLRVSQPQGRYLFHVMSALSIVVVCGISTIAQPVTGFMSRMGKDVNVPRRVAQTIGGSTMWIVGLIHPVINLLALFHVYSLYATR